MKTGNEKKNGYLKRNV